MMESSLHDLDGALFRPEFTTFSDHCYLEKRGLFLRSYHFSRKKTMVERIKYSLLGVKRTVWLRLQTARKLHPFFCLRLRLRLRLGRFRLRNPYYYRTTRAFHLFRC